MEQQSTIFQNLSDTVYGFYSFEGLPEKWRNGFDKGAVHSRNGELPVVNSNVQLIIDILKDYIDTDCIIVFDELVNYPGFEDGELKAFYEFITENKVDYEWIGMDGTIGMSGYYHENVAVIIHSINA